MIAIDTSALMAIGLNEPQAEACIAALEAEDEVLISAGTVAEVLIVAARRNIGSEMSSVIADFGFEVVPVTPASARRIAAAISGGVGVCIRPASISAIASPMRSRRNMAVACSSSGTTSRKPTFRACCRADMN